MLNSAVTNLQQNMLKKKKNQQTTAHIVVCTIYYPQNIVCQAVLHAKHSKLRSILLKILWQTNEFTYS